MRMFWQHGCAAVSIPDICAATGLSTSSIYNSFGTKLDLLVAALARYHDTVLEQFMLGPMARGEHGLADVAAFLDRLGSTLDATAARGCLAVNTIAEFRDPPPSVAEHTARYRQLLRESLRAALSRAGELGQIPPDSVDTRTDALVPMVLAFNLLTAAQAPSQERRELLSAALELARR